MDNAGNKLTEDQLEYFKKSRPSNLQGRGFYFANSKSHAEQYGAALCKGWGEEYGYKYAFITFVLVYYYVFVVWLIKSSIVHIFAFFQYLSLSGDFFRVIDKTCW